MRKLALIGIVLAVVLVVAPSIGDTPSGSHEEDGDPPVWDNQVTCGSGTATPIGVVYVSQSNGVEVCNDGRGALPVQGRFIATTDQGGYVAADGDADNPAQARGWVRVDQGGVRCGDDNGRLDSTHPTAEDTQADCG